MNAVDRQRIREARDQHVREARARFLKQVGRSTCAGCDGDLDTTTQGCKTCSDRNSRRPRRR